MKIQAIQNYSQSPSFSKGQNKGNSVKNSLAVDSVSFKGYGSAGEDAGMKVIRGVQATAGTAVAGVGAAAAAGVITVAAAPVVVPALIIVGTAAALHGIVKGVMGE